MNEKWHIVIVISLIIIFSFIDNILKFLHVQPGVTLEIWLRDIMPVVLLFIFFLLILWVLEKHKREISYILETHLPTTRFIINNPKLLTNEMVSTVKEANEFIMATGGKARDDKYLKAIENKIIKHPLIEYKRILLGDYIHHRLHQHIDKLLECSNVQIRWYKTEIYGNILVSEKQVFLFLADPKPEVFGSGQILAQPEIALQYKEHVLRLYADAQDINKEEIKTRCFECNPNIKIALEQNALNLAKLIS